MSSAPPLSLKLLNSMNRTGFATALGFAFELSPWVVERAWSERPFASVETLHAAMMDVLGAASLEDKLALIRAHPELASKAAIAKQLTAESNAEQASAGLDRLTPEEFARTLRNIAEGRVPVEPLITGKAGLDGVAAAFEELANPERHAKIVVEPWRSGT